MNEKLRRRKKIASLSAKYPWIICGRSNRNCMIAHIEIEIFVYFGQATEECGRAEMKGTSFNHTHTHIPLDAKKKSTTHRWAPNEILLFFFSFLPLQIEVERRRAFYFYLHFTSILRIDWVAICAWQLGGSLLRLCKKKFQMSPRFVIFFFSFTILFSIFFNQVKWHSCEVHKTLWCSHRSHWLASNSNHQTLTLVFTSKACDAVTKYSEPE